MSEFLFFIIGSLLGGMAGVVCIVKWYLEGTEIKSETKATVNDAQDIVVYELEAEQAIAGTLKLEVIYKDTVLRTQELKIQ